MTADENSTPAGSRRKIWKTTLLLFGSVAFGGLAVALWNRGELAQMRDQRPDPAPQEVPAHDVAEEEIF
jgi:hypothetical protein